MPVHTDQTGRVVLLPVLPKRIVSLVPSQTELLYSLGLEEEVVGITRFCIHPEKWFRSKTRVGGTKQIKTALIRQLQPDLVIANKEENVKEQVEELAKEFPVWVSDVHDLESAYKMMYSIGTLTGKITAAAQLVETIRNEFFTLSLTFPVRSVAYLIWRHPYMVAGGDTFIHAMLEQAGFRNAFAGLARYPALSAEDISRQNPELVFLSSEPYPFREQHIRELQQSLPQAKILLVDGELFNWYGSRLQYAPAYFMQLRETIGNTQ